MGLKAGWLALFLFVWTIGAFLGSTFEFHETPADAGMAYSTGTATFTYGSATVTGAGTTWNDALMANGNIQSDTDAVWYKIASVESTISLTLFAVYAQSGGAGHDYIMQVAPGWAGSGSGGYRVAPITTIEFLFNIDNAIQRIELLGAIPFPVPNPEYFETAWRVVTWRWSFMVGYEMFYWIVCAPFVVMGVLSLIMLVYGVLTGNLTL